MKRIYKFLLPLAFVISALAAWLFYGPFNGIIVLEYHRVHDDNSIYSISPNLFDRQMQYLAENGYTAISLEQLEDGLANKSPLPSKSVLITFDDGYEDNYSSALPILEKYGMRSVAFIIIDKVGQPNYLTWDEVKDMQVRNTEIESHTLSHRSLIGLNPDEQKNEIETSKTILEQHVGRPVTYFSYPYGDFDASMFSLLQRAGYHGAFSGINGINFPGQNTFTLKRIDVLKPQSGIWGFTLLPMKTVASTNAKNLGMHFRNELSYCEALLARLI